jgi:pilus assembly protein Flp/PilA
MLRRLVLEEDGQGLVEYALIIGLVAVAMVTVLGKIDTALKNKFIDICGALQKPAKAF